jgi:hypothetical protein
MVITVLYLKNKKESKNKRELKNIKKKKNTPPPGLLPLLMGTISLGYTPPPRPTPAVDGANLPWVLISLGMNCLQRSVRWWSEFYI